MGTVSRRLFLASSASALAAQDPAVKSIFDAANRLRARTITSVQLTETCLRRIETYNPKLNAFITVMKTQAMARS